MEKGPLVSSLLSALEPLQAQSPQWGRALQGENTASGWAVERQLSARKHTGPGCPQDQEKGIACTLHNREPWRHTFSPKTIHPGAFLAWHSSLLLPRGCAPKNERHTAVCAGKPPHFYPFWSHKSHLDKAENECRKRSFWHLTHGGVSPLVLNSAGPQAPRAILLLLLPKCSNRGIFFFSSMNYAPPLPQYRV